MTDFLDLLRKRFPGASVVGLQFSKGRLARVEWTAGPCMFVEADFEGDWTIELFPTTAAKITAVGHSLNRCLERLHEVLLAAELTIRILKGKES